MWSSESIIAEIERDVPDRRPLMRDIEAHAEASALIQALATSANTFTRILLCDMLGNVRPQESVTVLSEALEDGDPGVRAAAADALGKVFGYVQVPPSEEQRSRALDALLTRWNREESDTVRSTLAQTLALVGGQRVRAVLESAVDHNDPRVRRQARWGLEYLDTKL